jgi:predicted ATP-dependent endonuclease of OLD family
VRLLEVEVENFRAFRSASMTLAEDGPVLIAGASNAGKTTL